MTDVKVVIQYLPEEDKYVIAPIGLPMRVAGVEFDKLFSVDPMERKPEGMKSMPAALYMKLTELAGG